MVERARRKAVRKGADVSFREGSIADIPYPDSHFDTVMCSFMIYHMPEDVRRKGLAGIYRVLKPGGRLFVIDTTPLDKLALALEESAFMEVEVRKTKLIYMGLWYLSGIAKKP